MRGVFANFQKSLASAIVAALTITGVLTLGSSARIAGNLIPSADNVYDVGSAALEWRTGYFGTSLASPAISVTSTGAGITLYNTTDQVTNFEKADLTWASNVLNLTTTRGGTGTSRDFRIAMGGWGASDGLTFSAGGSGICFYCFNRTYSSANTAITRMTGTNTASSNTSEALQLDPTINQSGTAGYNVLSIDPTITAEGSGGTKLLRLAVGGTDQFYIDKNGYTYAGGSYASLTDGDGYYFGDSVRGLRYLTGDDFEFQNWHVGGQFYMTVFNGSARTRFAVFDSPTKRAAFSDSVDLRNYTPNTSLEVLGTASSTNLVVNGGTSIKGHLSTTASLDFASVSAQSCSTLTMTVTGAATTDNVVLGGTGLNTLQGTTGIATVQGYVSAADTVTVKACNVTGSGSSDPASVTIRADVWKH